MKTTLVLVLTLLALDATAEAAVPLCELGGPTAVNPNRQLADGETFVVTDRPLVVNLRFRPTKAKPEQVGECLLPSGSKVAQKDGYLMWVAECGNDEVNQNIRVGPTILAQGLQGVQGLKGDPGPPGAVGPQGPIGPQGSQGRNFEPEGEGGIDVPWKKIFLGAAIVGGTILGIKCATDWCRGDDHKLDGKTKPATFPADKPIRTTGAVIGMSFSF